MQQVLKILIDDAKKIKIALSASQAQKLLQYLDILRQWNKVHNLCADASYQHMLSYHLLDSISVASSIDCQNKSILDVGTGAGLPGIPLSIVVPDCSVTMLDSKFKKISFVNHVINVLELKNATTFVSRLEKYTPLLKFDLIISRAFSSLLDFVKLSSRLCADGGMLVAMKSDPEEFVVGADVIDDYKIIEVKKLTIPGVSAKRCLVVVSCKNLDLI